MGEGSTVTVKSSGATPKKKISTPNTKSNSSTPATKRAKAATPKEKVKAGTNSKTSTKKALTSSKKAKAAEDLVPDEDLVDNSFSSTIDHVGGEPLSGRKHWLRSDHSKLYYPGSGDSPSSDTQEEPRPPPSTKKKSLLPKISDKVTENSNSFPPARLGKPKEWANKKWAELEISFNGFLGTYRSRGMKSTSRNSTKLCLQMLLPLLLVLVEFMCRTFLDLPLLNLCRNMVLPPTPPPVKGRYQCTAESLASDVTIVVTVKDACSQAPGFINALHTMVPDSVHLIYTYPNFSSCANIPGMHEELDKWQKVTKLPLGLRVSPMRGWVDAVPFVKTPYALLLHNDGYALDPFFACELVGALKARKRQLQLEQKKAAGAGDNGKKKHELTSGGEFVVAAPMLFESKADLSLAAHATQSNLRLVKEADKPTGRTVRHDHSIARALNRGYDFGEGPQSEFLEDHGFMIETDKIATVIDPHASYTLEYLDMIMTIRSNNWQVLFVPTARLEFRVTEFSWRDIPYFMYKRSEATCHGTRDYLTRKWGADFPNTGFWTYIKYTIVEQHVFGEKELAELEWKDSASVVFGFFQMLGFNHYAVNGFTSPSSAAAATGPPGGAAGAGAGEDEEDEPEVESATAAFEEEKEAAAVAADVAAAAAAGGGGGGSEATMSLDFIGVLEKLEKGWRPGWGVTVEATRSLERQVWPPKQVRKTAAPIDDILETKPRSRVRIEADMPLEYLPFAALELKYFPAPVPASPGSSSSSAAAFGSYFKLLNNGGSQIDFKRGLDLVPPAVLPLCGLVVAHPGTGPHASEGASVSCWVNLPTFKSNSFFMKAVDKFAALIKLPSRVTTFLEMAMGSTRSAKEHVHDLRARLFNSTKPLRGDPSLALVACEHSDEEEKCLAKFHLGPADKVLQFMGRPPSAWELLDALDS